MTPPTASPDLARILHVLVDERQGVFTFDSFCEIAGVAPRAARQLLHELMRLGLLCPLRPDVAADTFQLLPHRLGLDPRRLAPPYLLVPRLVGEGPYFVSHASAMEIHGMTTWQRPIVYVCQPQFMHHRLVAGTFFHVVTCRPAHWFGAIEHAVDRFARVWVSDLERTILDGLRQPKYVGGVAQVVVGFQIRRADVDIDRLVGYALRLGLSTLQRRLGYLLEWCRVDAPAALARLRASIPPRASYLPLDPTLPRRGPCCPRWRLHLNTQLTSIEGTARLSRAQVPELPR
ncbi:MAG: hypothetical protein RMK29_09470 [Myxococcales bacterium]|nr:hypothetical protein [Myxococcota bacterium]MDW8281929.1 hypothetical protein [Myxococcales bacterium]